MPATVFPTPVNNFASALAASHAIGSGTLAMAAGGGAALTAALAALGVTGAPVSAQPVRLTVVKAAAIDAEGQITDPTGLAHFDCTGLAADTLTGCAAADGTADQPFSAGDKVFGYVTAGQLLGAYRAINALESTAANLPSTYLTSAGNLAGVASAPAARTNLQVGADLTTSLGLDPTGLTAPQLATLAAARLALGLGFVHDYYLAAGSVATATGATTSFPLGGSFVNETSVYSGWAFPVGVRQNFNRVELSLRSYDAANPIKTVRIRVLTPDYAGTLLADKTFVLDPALPYNTSTITAFDLDTPILNPGSSGTLSSLTSSGTTATATTSAPHGLATGATVTIGGALPGTYNLTATITVTGASTFTYTLLSTSTSPATPTATITWSTAAPIWLEYYTDGRSGLLLGSGSTLYLDSAAGGTYTRNRYAGNSSVTTLQSNNYSSAQLNGWARFSLVDPTADSGRTQGSGGFKASVQSMALKQWTPTVALPTFLYSVVGHEMNVYYDKIIRSYRTSTDYEVRVTSAVGTGQDLRYTYTPASGDVGDKAWSVAFNLAGTTLATASPTLRVRAAKSTATVARKMLFMGDSVLAEGSILSELVNLFNANCTSPVPGGGPDNMTITLLGTKTTTVNDAGGTSRTVNHEAVTGKTIAYWATDPTSPFVFSGAFNFASYLTANSYTMASGDWFVIQLGINDLTSALTDAAFNTAAGTMKSQLDAMIASARAAVSGIRIGLAMLTPPAFHQDAFGANYGVSLYRARHKRNIDLWHESMVAFYGALTGSNQYLIPIHAALDTVNNMSTNVVAFNSRNANTTTRQSNGIHPASAGNYQLSDGYFVFFRGQET